MSLLATPPVCRRLVAELQDVDEVVLLGDLFGLRDGPVSEVLETGRSFLEELGRALDDRRVVIVPGNHDYQLAEPLLERQRLDGARGALAAECVLDPRAPSLAGSVASCMRSANVVLAYPGVWIRPDVYAIHGHYLDCHLTVPRTDAVLAALMKALTGGIPAGGATPDHYEAALAPLYAFSFNLAQAAAPASAGARPPAARLGKLLARQGWHQLKSQLRGGRARDRVLGGAALAALLAAINRSGLGSFKMDLSSEELGRASLRAMAEVVKRLGIDADHVIFGHTHRAGPLDGEPGWSVPGGPRLLNPGGWVYSPALVGNAAHRSPYWPGRVAFVGESGPPELRSFLDEATPARGAA
jgi:hypothetical protein